MILPLIIIKTITIVCQVPQVRDIFLIEVEQYHHLNLQQEEFLNKYISNHNNKAMERLNKKLIKNNK